MTMGKVNAVFDFCSSQCIVCMCVCMCVSHVPEMPNLLINYSVNLSLPPRPHPVQVPGQLCTCSMPCLQTMPTGLRIMPMAALDSF